MDKMQEAVNVMRSVGLCVSESNHPNNMIVVRRNRLRPKSRQAAVPFRQDRPSPTFYGKAQAPASPRDA